MKRLRLKLLFASLLAAFVGTFWFQGKRTSNAKITFVPLGCTTSMEGTPQQLFAISNFTDSRHEFVLARCKSHVALLGQPTSNLEAYSHFQLSPQSGTQVALSLPLDRVPWRATLNYRRVVNEPELSSKAVAYRFHVVGSNKVSPLWQAIRSQEFKK
ncbi:MAG: hypothetical protein M1608_09805 [Candidatus Omnitrophica bacterium]|nr:hypothetical protein [Candidatus Omnitrophota bacterium]